MLTTPSTTERPAVPRVGLLDHLEATSDTPVAAIIAPPGYGKTTVLTQWAEHDPRPFGWLTIDQRHNDPAVLLRSMAVALQLVDAVAHPPLSAIGSPGPSVMETLLPQLGAALSASARPAVLVLDDVHLLQSWDCLEAVASLIDYLPPGSQFAIAGRGEPPLPFARLRAEGRVVELGAGDLAMDRQEAGSLLEGTEVEVSQVDVTELVRVTEGWPVALHFAACSLRSGSGRQVAIAGVDRFLADYLQFTVLSSLPERLVLFLTRAAVLDQLSGPLCDAVLDRTGSADLLEALERSSLLVIPLDRRRQWYRLHPLFRKLLRARLERREPGLAGELAGRAAEWYERNHLPERAVGYAMAAGDRDRVERLVVDMALPTDLAGRTAVLRRWFDWFETSGPAGPSVQLAVLGAWLSALAGRPAAAERWADAAARASSREPSPDGDNPVDGHRALTDAAASRAVLWDVDDVLRRRPDLGVLGQQADELRTQLDTLCGHAIGASSLTAAEIRLFQLLDSHYSFREIGGQLDLSQHTVKSQAMSIYRKLGVSSRSQAIQHGRDLGLLEG